MSDFLYVWACRILVTAVLLVVVPFWLMEDWYKCRQLNKQSFGVKSP